jgi:hypothetical protein
MASRGLQRLEECFKCRSSMEFSNVDQAFEPDGRFGLKLSVMNDFLSGWKA